MNNDDERSPSFLTAGELAEIVRLDEELIASLPIPRYKFLGEVRYFSGDVVNYLNDSRKPAPIGTRRLDFARPRISLIWDSDNLPAA